MKHASGLRYTHYAILDSAALVVSPILRPGVDVVGLHAQIEFIANGFWQKWIKINYSSARIRAHPDWCGADGAANERRRSWRVAGQQQQQEAVVMRTFRYLACDLRPAGHSMRVLNTLNMRCV